MVYQRLVLFACVLSLCGACGPSVEEACGLDGAPPTEEEVLDGRLKAELDGEAFDEPGTWKPDANADITAGILTLIIANDETGTPVIDLVGRGAFPICVPLGERSPTVGQAIYGTSHVSDADHTGVVAILGEEGGRLMGRFEVELADQTGGGAEPVKLTNGRFRVERR